MIKSKPLTIPKAIKKANKLVKKGDLAVALKIYRAVLQHQPNNPVAKKGLNRVLKKMPDCQTTKKQISNPPQEQINTLANLYYSGQMIRAEETCQEMLRVFPKSLIILNIWGAILRKQGKLHKAVEMFDRALQLKPGFAEVYNNRGNALRDLGRIQDALNDYNKAIQLKPDYAEAYDNRGNALRDLGRNQAALNDYSKAIQLRPDYAEAYSNRGNSLRDLGRIQEALNSYNKAIQLKPDFAVAYSGRGVSLKDLGRVQEALNDYNKAIQLKPDFAEAYNNRGNALEGLGRTQEALNDYNKAVQLKPGFIEAYNSRGISLENLGRFQEALSDYGKAIQLKPDYAKAYNNRGNTLEGLGRVQEALNDYNKAIQLEPDYAEAYNNRGVSFKELGRFQEALDDFNNAIKIKPDYAEAHRHLSMLKKYKANDSLIETMERLFETDKITESDHMHLSFALAKAYEDIKDYDKSFQYTKRGNDLRKKELNYNLEKDRSIINRIMSIFDKKFEIIPPENDTVMPVFIVGMPRSGTTLVEQILASHSQIYGAGELNTMNDLGKAVLSRYLDQNTSLENYQWFQSAVKKFHDGYLKTLTDLHVTEKMIADKMPGNFIWIGFILSAFPEAKIINMNRDPRATCWSIYKHFFSSKGHGYAYDMVELAEYYHIYVDLLAFWRDCFPDKIYELCYEDLTENQEEETRRLLTYCGLELETQCLDFHKTVRIVQTASAAQVREKMYTGSSKAWKNYEKHIQPMIDKLSDIG